jgi:hypothetical protein
MNVVRDAVSDFGDKALEFADVGFVSWRDNFEHGDKPIIGNVSDPNRSARQKRCQTGSGRPAP